MKNGNIIAMDSTVPLCMSHNQYLVNIVIFIDNIDENVSDTTTTTTPISDPQYATIDQLLLPAHSKIPTILPVTTEELGTYILDCHNDNNKGFKDQYEVLSPSILY